MYFLYILYLKIYPYEKYVLFILKLFFKHLVG